MFKVFLCLAGVFLLLMIAEFLWHQKILKGENQRKFVHITVGCFVAFWPWLISWRQIQLLGLAMLAVVVVNRRINVLHTNGQVRRDEYGDIFYAAAIVLCSLLTTNKVFFVIAILHLCLADGLAAIVGIGFGRGWSYKIFSHTKTVLGSMAFWFVSLCILAVGVLAVHNTIPFDNYALLLLVLPPILTGLENLGGQGFDNLIVPTAVLVALNLAR